MKRYKNLKEIATGLPREILDYLEKNTELAKVAIHSHKKDFNYSILYLFVGFLFSTIGTIIFELIKENDTELINRQLNDFDISDKNQNIELQLIRSEIESLKILIETLEN